MSQLHQRPRSEASLSDEYETPNEIFEFLCKKYKIFPELDVCAEYGMNKCAKFYSKQENGLNGWWKYDSWCNPPQTECKNFVLKADQEWFENNINILMIVPANVLTSQYFSTIIDNVEFFPIPGRITFLVDGKKSKYPARNGYFVVIWRKRK